MIRAIKIEKLDIRWDVMLSYNCDEKILLDWKAWKVDGFSFHKWNIKGPGSQSVTILGMYGVKNLFFFFQKYALY